MIPVDGLSANEGNLLTVNFDYSLNDPDEVLYVHLWGLLGTASDNSLIMNLPLKMAAHGIIQIRALKW